MKKQSKSVCGTSCFVSLAAAIAYYSVYESDPVRAVKTKLKERAISIGKPSLKKGQRAVLLDGGLRYGIEA